MQTSRASGPRSPQSPERVCVVNWYSIQQPLHPSGYASRSRVASVCALCSIYYLHVNPQGGFSTPLLWIHAVPRQESTLQSLTKDVALQ